MSYFRFFNARGGKPANRLPNGNRFKVDSVDSNSERSNYKVTLYKLTNQGVLTILAHWVTLPLHIWVVKSTICDTLDENF